MQQGVWRFRPCPVWAGERLRHRVIGVGVVVQPSGTVTFLFTDIESSTRLWEEQPDLMRPALARHDEIVRAAIESHHGTVFATGGDGFAVAFGSSVDAVAAAVAAQRSLQSESWPEGVALRVRMGIHTGEAEERGGDYFGAPVNRAARLMAAAHGGQLVLSDATASVLGPMAGLALVDLGAHRLKSVADPMHVFGVDVDGLGWLDRALMTDQSVPGNLPRPATEFVGRIDALRDRAVELPQRRLVTLTGPGGVGKTRAAVEVGWLSVDAFPGGVWLVELAPIADESVVIAAIAASLSVQPQPGVSMLESVVEWLRGRKLLLILDNCEHVLSPVVQLVRAVLAGCTTVTVLATSREPLGVAGERVVPIASLAIDDAVELFRGRAAAADESLQFSVEDRALMAEICERLDGIPLAIELAAARVRSFTLADLSARLDDRFRLLRGSGRGGLERHQTLRAAVAWSYQLLSETERLVFDRVSVFAGGFDLAAAEAVWADDQIDTDLVEDVLSSLVEKSMVIADRTGRSVRYRLLETLRQFGEERLADVGATGPTRDRHVAHYLRLTREMRVLQMGPHQFEADDVFEQEWDNIRAAQSWAIASGDLECADDLLCQCGAFAFNRMRHEFSDWADRLLAVEHDYLARSSGLCSAAAALALMRGDFDRTETLDLRGIARHSDPASVAMCWFQLSLAFLAQGLVDESSTAMDEAEKAVAATTDSYAHFWVLYGRQQVLYANDEVNQMGKAARRLAEFVESCGAPWMANTAYLGQADICLLNADYQGATETARYAYELARAGRSQFDLVQAGSRILAAVLMDSDAPPTLECREVFNRVHDARNWLNLSLDTEVIANNLARRGFLEPASRIVGYLDAHFSSWPGIYTEQRLATRKIVRLNKHAAEWMAAGAAMDRDQIFEYTLAQLPEETESQP